MNVTKNTETVIETKKSFPFKGVIFDMDGTLIESTEADYEAWKLLFADYGQQLSFEDYFPLIGMKSAVVVQTRLHLDEEEAIKALAQKLNYFNAFVQKNGINTVPFAGELLQQLKQYHIKIALATSSRSSKVKMVLELLELNKHFDVIVNGDHVKRSKPAPDIFLLAAKELNLSPADCVVIEDAASGVKAAKNAGMKCIAITTTHKKHLLAEADLVIDSYEDLNLQHFCALTN
jgi:beta-phosphoglucomutase family hydrolase